jgi:cellulose synthase/poly-beta-1,6-N-acetylglucosamine synthase-like glycosyltransferase
MPSKKVSVVIACRNEEKVVPNLLQDLSSQIYPSELLEVIVVDDNSTDNTFKEASSFRQITGLKVMINNGNGKKSAIKTGLEIASGDLIITTDADCRVGNSWISIITSFYEENKPDMIIGPIQLRSSSGFFGRFQELEFLSLQGITAGTTAAGNPVMCNGANLAFTKETYAKHAHNLHDEILSGDDIFFLHSLKKDKKAKIMWLSSKEAVATTTLSNSLISFLSQRARWISKGKAYKDSFTIFTSIVTFVTILLIISVLFAGLFRPAFLLVFLTLLLIKSVPDLLILDITTRNYGKNQLLKWFIPSQIVYPFYVVGAILCSVFMKPKWK